MLKVMNFLFLGIFFRIFKLFFLFYFRFLIIKINKKIKKRGERGPWDATWHARPSGSATRTRAARLRGALIYTIYL